MRIFRKKEELVEPPIRNPGGDVNMAWMRWYNAKYGGSFMHAQAAYEALTYPNLEPSLFEEEACWEKMYLSQYPDATDKDIAIVKFNMLQRRVLALGNKQPVLSTGDAMINMEWLYWYAAMHGCSLAKAGVEAAKRMVHQGIFPQGASLAA